VRNLHKVSIDRSVPLGCGGHTATSLFKRQWDKFLHTHRLYHPETYQKRLDILCASGERDKRIIPAGKVQCATDQIRKDIRGV